MLRISALEDLVHGMNYFMHEVPTPNVTAWFVLVREQ